MRQASRETGAALAARLRERRAEIEQATLARVISMSELPRSGGPEYAEGLRQAVAAAVEFGLTGVELGEERVPAIPDTLLAQARLAARSGVSLDTVLRRYLAGHALLDDFLIDEADRIDPHGPEVLKRLLRTQAAIVDRLLTAVSKTYMEEAQRRPRGLAHQRRQRIARLLGGEPLDTASLAYEFGGHHTALLALGPEAEVEVRAFASTLDCETLVLVNDDGTVWAWLGSRRPLDPGALCRRVLDQVPSEVTIAFGESGEGIASWRLSHRQARAALSVSLRGGKRVVRYADVALLATVMADELLTTSLRRLYLEPLAEMPDGGDASLRTLKAYFAAGQNTTSAAAALGVNRNTVTNRLRAIEDRFGESLNCLGVEFAMALRLGELCE